MAMEGWSTSSRHVTSGVHDRGTKDHLAEVARAPGEPLESAARHRMETGFGQDFSQVRLHTGPLAAQSAKSIAAAAYTRGQHIVFGAGAYNPGTHAGNRILAHELTHVVQQRSSGTPHHETTGYSGTGAAHDHWEMEADAAAHAASSTGDFNVPLSLGQGTSMGAPAIQRQPLPEKTAPETPIQVLQLPLLPPEWLHLPGRSDLLLGRLGDHMVALPALGAFTMLEAPPMPAVPADPITVLSLPTVAKESLKMVSAGGSTGFLIDAGGERLVVTPAAMAAMTQSLGVQNLAGIIITHLHEDHVQSLFDIVITNGVRPENLRFPEAFLTNIAAPSSLFARLVRDLGNDPRGQQLGYGPTARFGSIPTPTQGDWWRTEIIVGDMTIEAYGLTAAFRELEAKRSRGEEQTTANLPGGARTKQLADTASLLLRYTHRPTGFRSMFVSDERYTDLQLLKIAMGRTAYAEIFSGVRVVEGPGHHMGAIESSAEQTAFGTFLKDVQLGSSGGRVTFMAQSQETRSGRQFLNRSAIAAMNEAGIDVHVAMEPAGATVGDFNVNSEGRVTYSGGGRAESFLSSSPIKAEIARLNNLRTVERTLALYEQYAEPQHRRSAEFKQARENLEAELNAFFDSTARNTRKGARGRAQNSVSDPVTQAAALARVRSSVAPVEALVTPGYMAGISELSRIGNFSEVFRREVEASRTSGRISDRGIEALWNLDPEGARKLLSRSGLGRKEQRRVAASLPGAPASVPVRLVAVGLLAIQVAEIAAPIADSIRASRFDDHVRPALEALMWWQRAGVFPEMEAVDDNLWPFSNEWTTDSARIQELLNDREISYLTLTGIPDQNWDRFTIWSSARLKNQLDWALYISSSPAIRRASGQFMGEQKYEYYTSVVHGDTVGFTLTETWQHSDRLDLILNAAALAVVDRSNTEIARAGEVPGLGLHGSIKSSDDQTAPLFDTLPRASGRWKFALDAEPELYTTFLKTKVTGYNRDAVFYSFPAQPHQNVPDSFMLVGGADYNTFSAIVGTRNDYKISNVDGYGGWRAGTMMPNTDQVLLAKKSDLVALP